MFSHFIAKLVTRLEVLGSAIMRRTCFSKTDGAPGLVNPPAAASVSSSSSGPVFHKKKERREANSRSVRDGVPRIERYKKSGLASTAVNTCSIPKSKLPLFLHSS